jgi:hypothetical protein
MSIETPPRPDISPGLPQLLGDNLATESLVRSKIPLDTAPLPEHNKETDYRILLTPGQRAEFIHYTDGLIQEMTEQRTDVAIFLDKSARPVAWMVNELWDQLRPHLPNGEILPRPKIKFLNIDKEQWEDTIGRKETSGINADLLPQKAVDSLRSIYKSIEPNDSEETMLSGKRVLIVDEVNVTGNTLEMAEKMLKRIFPDAKEIKGYHWMNGKIIVDQNSGVSLNSAQPPWYQRRESGRLILNRDQELSLGAKSSRQKIGGLWLSRGRNEAREPGMEIDKDGPDHEGLELKADIKLLADDFRKGNLPYVPSSLWDDDTESIDSRISRMMNGMTVEEYAKLRDDYWTYELLCLAMKTIVRTPKIDSIHRTHP